MRREASALLSDGSNSSFASSLSVLRYEAWAPVIGSSPVVHSDGSFSVLDGVPPSGDFGSAALSWSFLALAMVEEDRGHRAALEIARQLVLFLKRPGGQSQFSSHVMAEADAGSPVRAVQDWIVANPSADLRVEALADRARMSPRNFARVFLRETGTTPQKFVEGARLDAARACLERTREPVERIAEAAGFGTAETMRRTFLRRLGVTPQDYRSHFRAEAAMPAA